MITKAIEIDYQGERLRGFLDLPDSVSEEDGRAIMGEGPLLPREEFPSIGEKSPKKMEKRIPLVIQFHGMCGRCDSKIDLALMKYFTGQGMAVVRVNFLGHGNSDGDFFQVTVPGQLPQAEAILAYAQSLPFAGEILIVGHSMGAVAATMLAGKHAEEIEKMILLAPASVIETLCQTGQFGDFEYDPADPPEMIEIPGTRFRFSREYLVSGKYIDIMSWAAKFKKPVCIIHGDQDDMLPLEVIQPFVHAFTDCQFKIIEGASHFFGGSKKEMVACVDEFLRSHKVE